MALEVVSAVCSVTENVALSFKSRSVRESVPTTSAKLLSAAVSVYAVAVRLAVSVGVSFAPVIAMLKACDAVAPPPSVTVKVKLSVALAFKPSILASLGTYL